MWYEPIVFISHLYLFSQWFPIPSKKAWEIQSCGEWYHIYSRQIISQTEQIVGSCITWCHHHFYFYIFDGHRCNWGWASQNLGEWMDPWLLEPWLPTFRFMPQQFHLKSYTFIDYKFRAHNLNNFKYLFVYFYIFWASSSKNRN